jgi:hypothetical protein
VYVSNANRPTKIENDEWYYNLWMLQGTHMKQCEAKYMTPYKDSMNMLPKHNHQPNIEDNLKSSYASIPVSHTPFDAPPFQTPFDAPGPPSFVKHHHNFQDQEP